MFFVFESSACSCRKILKTNAMISSAWYCLKVQFHNIYLYKTARRDGTPSTTNTFNDADVIDVRYWPCTANSIHPSTHMTLVTGPDSARTFPGFINRKELEAAMQESFATWPPWRYVVAPMMFLSRKCHGPSFGYHDSDIVMCDDMSGWYCWLTNDRVMKIIKILVDFHYYSTTHLIT